MVTKIYADKCTVNCHKVLAGLDLLEYPYEFVSVDYFKSEQKDPANTRFNPFATVPFAVLDSGDVLTESNAILMYAADQQKNDQVYPKDPVKRAQINSWLLWETSAWFPSNYIYLVEYIVKPLLGAEPDPAVIAAEAPRWHRLAKILDDQLAKNKFIAGEHVTLADIAVGSGIHLHEHQKLPLGEYKNLQRWITQDMEQEKSWTSTQRDVDKALAPGKFGRVKASVNYTKELEQPPEIYFYDHENASKVHEPGDSPNEVEITDGWPIVDTFTLDKDGFEVKGFKAKFNNWDDEGQIANHLYPEVVDFLKRTTGAKRVLVFDHTIRTKANVNKSLTDEKATSQRAPVMLVHCDYTSESAPKRVRQLLPNEADDLLSRRVTFVNVWKPIKHIVEEKPLAMLAVESSPPEDFMKLYLRYRDRDGENYVLKHSDKHKWYYFPRITPDEVILLKTYDSEQDGRARFVAHTAFDHAETENPRTRESLEIRTICFF